MLVACPPRHICDHADSTGLTLAWLAEADMVSQLEALWCLPMDPLAGSLDAGCAVDALTVTSLNSGIFF